MIALVPIKEHSERIPNKTFAKIKDKPLFSFIIDSLMSSVNISKIVINTDSENLIEKVNKIYSSEKIIFINRPKNLVGDLVPMNSIIDYDISQFDEEHFIQTHITSPLLNYSTIDDAIDFYYQNKEIYDSIVSVNKYKNRFYNHLKIPINHSGDANIARTQDLKPIYEENSCFYIFSKDSFKKSGKNRIGKKPFYYSINKLESVDIDYPEDLELARSLYENK